MKKHWMFRPIAWICTVVMILCLQYASELICRLGEYLFSILDGLPTVAVILLVMAFGGVFSGIVLYSLFMLPAIIVTASDKIYPSHHAFRYYLVGIYSIAGCAFLIYAAAIGAVRGTSMFWFYVRYIWQILAYITMMIMGHTKAKERYGKTDSIASPEINDEKQEDIRNLKKQIETMEHALRIDVESYEESKKYLQRAYTDEELKQLISRGAFPADRMKDYIDKREALAAIVDSGPQLHENTIRYIEDLKKQLSDIESSNISL